MWRKIFCLLTLFETFLFHLCVDEQFTFYVYHLHFFIGKIVLLIPKVYHVYRNWSLKFEASIINSSNFKID